MTGSNETLELNEVCEAIIDCEHKTAPRSKTGYPSIRTPNIGRGYFLLEGVYHVDQETYEKWTQRGTPKSGDLILAREAPVGNVAIIPKGLRPCLGQRTVLIKPNRERVNPRYLNYLLLGDEVQGHIHAQTNGATVPHLNMKDIRALPLPRLPDLPTQRKIAGILSAYDDLIENNLRRIRILEEMAQSLYREWFVHFRFPGHESVQMVDSPLGPIPEGWEVKKLGELAEVNRESIRKSSAPETIHYIDIKSVTEGTISEKSTMSFSEAPSRARRVVSHGDVIWSTVRPNLRSFAFVANPPENTIASTGFAVLTATKIPFAYLYLATTTQDFTTYLVNHTSGAAYPAVNASAFEEADLVLPPDDLMNRFNLFAENAILLQAQFHTRNQTLRRTRDLILPKLLSGNSDS